MARPRLTEEELELVAGTIIAATIRDGGPVSAPELARLLGLNTRQVYHRAARLRDDGWVAVRHDGAELPLLSSYRGYIFSGDPDANRQFRYSRSKTGMTIFRRTYNEAVARFIATLPVALQATTKRRLGRSFERVIEDISDIVAMEATVPVESGT